MLRRFSVDYWSAGEQSITVSSDDMDFLAVFVGNLQVPPRAPNENERSSPLVFLFGAAIFVFGEPNLLCKLNWLSPAK